MKIMEKSFDTTIAYLVNQYPKVSHSFIRREIIALEAMGIKVLRFSIRPLMDDLADVADVDESDKTRVILGIGLSGLWFATIRGAFTKPFRWLRAMSLTIRLGYQSDRGLLRHIAYLAEACVLEEWLRQHGVKHVHAHFGTNSTAVAMLCHELGGPGYSFTVHGAAEFDRLTTIGIRIKIQRARFVVAVSLFGRSQLYRYCNHEDWPKIRIIRCGVDDIFLQQDPTPIPQTSRLVCVGRLCNEKGQLLLIEAAGRLKADGIDIELVFVGDGELRQPLEQLILYYSLQEKVRITGWISGAGVQQEILASRAMILPSFMEGLPVVIMEAFAMARPVISTYIAGIPELVRHGENGWLVYAGSVESLVAAIKEVLETPVGKLNIMGQTGREQILAYHHTSTEVKKLVTLFREHINIV